MRASSSVIDNNKVKLTVTLDDAEFDKALDETAVALAQQVSVKGFRKGKVPRNVLVAHIGGAEVLRAEAIREKLPDFYARAVSETKIDPIGQPELNLTSGEDDGPLSFEAEVEVRPVIAVSGYRDLRVTIPSPVVSDDELDTMVAQYLESDAELRVVDRPIVTNDVLTLDVSAEFTEPEDDDKPIEMTDFVYTVGSGNITAGVDELIVGLKKGEELKLAGPLANRVATFVIGIKQISEKVLPELTDEWVSDNTDWDSAEAMRGAILEQLRRRKVIETQLSQRDAMLLALAELVSESDVPASLVEAETQERLHELGHRLSQQNLDFEMFLQVTNQSPETLLETLRADATRAVRVDLALRGVVAAQGLAATDDDIAEELDRTAESMGVKVETLRENLYDSGRVVAFEAEVAKMKASRWLQENLIFIDENGATIDKALLAMDQSQGLDG